MQPTSYAHRIELDVPYEEAIERTTAALKEQGFGVLTTIDVKDTLKTKLDADFRKYVILGACNPPLARRALSAELEVGLLLPCNVIVYETEPGKSAVSAMAPLSALGIVGNNEALRGVAQEADEKLKRALASLESRAV
ncbi:MAG TPA: DUF302 domain-containing protein [Vicinamibacteria bacterium]